MKKVISFLSLFTSASTLLCCALPALFVLLGMGAAFAGLVGAFPQIIWLSEHKIALFAFGGIMLLVGGLLQLRARADACTIDAQLGVACAETRDWSKYVYFFSLALYMVGGFFSFVAPLIF